MIAKYHIIDKSRINFKLIRLDFNLLYVKKANLINKKEWIIKEVKILTNLQTVQRKILNCRFRMFKKIEKPKEILKVKKVKINFMHETIVKRKKKSINV